MKCNNCGGTEFKKTRLFTAENDLAWHYCEAPFANANNKTLTGEVELDVCTACRAPAIDINGRQYNYMLEGAIVFTLGKFKRFDVKLDCRTKDLVAFMSAVVKLINQSDIGGIIDGWEVDE